MHEVSLSSRAVPRPKAENPVAMRIELDPRVAGGGAGGRQDRLIRGRVVTTLDVASVALMFRGTMVGRIEYPEAGRPAREFHFNLNFPSVAGDPDVEFAIDVADRAGAHFRSEFRLAVDHETGRIVGGATGDPAVLERMTAPVFVYAERAEIGGVLNLEGWAACFEGSPAVEIRAGGRVIGEAALSDPHPLVESTFPAYPGHNIRGFAWSGAVGHATDIAIRAVGTDGSSHEIPVDAGPAAEDFHSHLDSPALAGNIARCRSLGRLTIQGWVIGPSPIAAIDVRMNGKTLGAAWHGLVRQDVAAAFPRHAGALRAGFAFHCPPRALTPGSHAIELVAVTEAGRAHVIAFTVEVDPSDAPLPHETIRGRMPAAEAETGAGIVAALAGPRDFCLVLCQPATLDASALRATLHSLRSQVHGDWRLRIAAADKKTVFDVTALIAATEADIASRIKVDSGTNVENHPPGTLVGILRPGDRLGCDALLEIALEAGKFRRADFFYADDSRRSPATGERQPFFKPDWSPDLLLAADYVGRAWFATAALLARAGISSDDLAHGDGFDLVLRATEKAAGIRHVQKLLWLAADEPPAPDAERAALTAAIARRGIDGEILAGISQGTWRLQRAIPAAGRVSIVIPTAGIAGHVRACIDSLRALTAFGNFEIVVIDNIPARERTCRQYVAKTADRVIRRTDTFNWSRFNNAAAATCTGEFLLFLNDDTEIIEPGWLDALVEHAQHPEVGAVGARLLYPDRTVQHAGMFLSRPGIARHAFRHLPADEPGYFGLAQTPRNVIAVTGACLLVRRSLFERLGGFDEDHPVVAGDLDFCLRVHAAGRLTVVTPHSTLIHHEFASRDRLAEQFDAARFERSWGTLFSAGDPYFSPHLDRHADDYAPEDEPVVPTYAAHPLFRRDTVKAILVVKLDHIGDFVTALPAIARLRLAFPAARLCLLAGPAVGALVETVKEIDEFIAFEFFHARSGLGPREVTPRQLADLRDRLEPYRFDLAIDLRKQPDTRAILAQAGARLLAGFDHRGEFAFLDVALEWEGDRALQRKRGPIANDLVNLVRAVETASEPRRADAHMRGETGKAPEFLSKADCALWSRPVVAVHPGVGNELRQWPPGHFAAVINLLTERNGVAVVLIGGADETEISEQVLALVADRKSVRSLVGHVALRDLPALLRSCALFIGNNSGPKHIAANLGIATIGIHSGVVDAAEWGPVGDRAVALARDMACSPCYLDRIADCPRDHACMKQLEPALVHQMAQTFLARAVA